MSKPKNKPTSVPKPKPAASAPATLFSIKPVFGVIGVCLFTAAVFFPMLQNGFTNWDDPLYVLDNKLLRGPDWAGIFSTSNPVASNYHPLTVASLAVNYQLSGEEPFSYHLLNWLLHIANTGLVFWLAFMISNRNGMVALLVALFFGIHPMHVESVAWVSERKDVLYTFFYLLALGSYWRFAGEGGWGKYAAALVFFVLSLLAKPAAVVLPLALLLFDWYRGRDLRGGKLWLEKLPFFALALLFGIIALQTQSVRAIAKPEFYPFWQKIVFAGVGFSEYIKRFFWPMPLSTFHPFPASGEVPTVYKLMVFSTLAIVAATIYFRKNRPLVFGLLFYFINVVIVLQLLTFGNAIIAERYTYVPYIGLAFALAMFWAESSWSAGTKNMVFGLFLAGAVGLSVLTVQAVKTWHDSQTLWTNVLKTYPRNHIARSNRAFDLALRLKKPDEALADFNIALETKPDHDKSLENRAVLFLQKRQAAEAFRDADALVRVKPDFGRAYLLRGNANGYLGKVDEAIADYSKCVELDPENDEAWGNRGSYIFNFKKDFQAAKADFDRALALKPKAMIYFNRARCWRGLGDLEQAKKDVAEGMKLGEKVPADLAGLEG
ncbi:MAG: tetratricopeptide repeat protein [Saprospiraceae bacterium]